MKHMIVYISLCVQRYHSWIWWLKWPPKSSDGWDRVLEGGPLVKQPSRACFKELNWQQTQQTALKIVQKCPKHVIITVVYHLDSRWHLHHMYWFVTKPFVDTVYPCTHTRITQYQSNNACTHALLLHSLLKGRANTKFTRRMSWAIEGCPFRKIYLHIYLYST